MVHWLLHSLESFTSNPTSGAPDVPEDEERRQTTARARQQSNSPGHASSTRSTVMGDVVDGKKGKAFDLKDKQWRIHHLALTSDVFYIIYTRFLIDASRCVIAAMSLIATGTAKCPRLRPAVAPLAFVSLTSIEAMSDFMESSLHLKRRLVYFPVSGFQFPKSGQRLKLNLTHCADTTLVSVARRKMGHSWSFDHSQPLAGPQICPPPETARESRPSALRPP